MVYDYSRDEISRQIERLLAYPQVGPLAPAAVAINLGASMDMIEGALEDCLAAGRVVRLADGRLTCPKGAD